MENTSDSRRAPKSNDSQRARMLSLRDDFSNSLYFDFIGLLSLPYVGSCHRRPIMTKSSSVEARQRRGPTVLLKIHGPCRCEYNHANHAIKQFTEHIQHILAIE